MKYIYYFCFRAYNIPEKYVRQIEKRFDSMNNSRFTKSYHGKK